ncbi:CPBP family intramembrane metalloprotease [soil metagenome]
MARACRWWPIAAIVLALVVTNVASNRVVPNSWYAPFAVVISVALVAFAVRVDGRSLHDLGLARSQAPRGARWGLAVAAAVVLIYLAGLALPLTRDLFQDERVADLSFLDTLYAAFVRVPVGTVLLEEVAFRAVLPAVLLARTRLWVAVSVSAVLFGLWHILPAIGLEEVNPVAEDTVGQLPAWVTVAGAVASTTVSGLWLYFLRHRSGSVLAPMIAHWSTNGLGYLFAFAVWRG